MSNTSVIYVVAASAGALSLAAFMGLVLVPAWGAYQRFWQRVVVTVLSLYVLAALIGIGALVGYGIFRLYSGGA